ncbi:MAG: phospholipase D-like domain-containing protein [Casimicrobiaceae bacterium]
MNTAFVGCLLASLALSAHADPGGADATKWRGPSSPVHAGQFYPGSLVIQPEDGRGVYLDAFAAARREIRIEICVLEDPQILQSLKQAIDRGIRVRVIVDNGKYSTIPAEQANLDTYVTRPGGKLHVSNPIFPRSFPKVILVDERYAVVGSACLDSTTFAQYRDYAYVTDEPGIIDDLSRLFENDWLHSAGPHGPFPTYNPTPVVLRPDLIVAPVNAAAKLVAFIQNARRTLDVTSELLGNPTLESELASAVARGVRVRLIAPEMVNGATASGQELQVDSLRALAAAGVRVNVTRPPETAQTPYMHARTAVADGRRAYLGSISLSPDGTTYNREVGPFLYDRHLVDELQTQFEIDFHAKSQPY